MSGDRDGAWLRVVGDGGMGDRAARAGGSGRVDAGGVEAVGRDDTGTGEAAHRVGAAIDLTPTLRQVPARTAAPSRARAWAELLRIPALFTVPGDALAGAAATGVHPNRRTLLAIGSSLLLYEAGMALNDWADRDEDAVERPHRPLPSGRIHPTAALTAACAFTAGGLALAARAGRPALAVAVPLAATVWAYDLAAKHTPAGPPAMGLARGLDVLLGAAATAGRTRAALPSAAVLGAHTLAVTTVSRQETRGGSPLAPLAALATTAVLSRLLTRPSTRHASADPSTESPAGTSRTPFRRPSSDQVTAADLGLPATTTPAAKPSPAKRPLAPPNPAAMPSPAANPSPAMPPPATPTPLPPAPPPVYAATAARPYFHATLNPSPPLTPRAVPRRHPPTNPPPTAPPAPPPTRACPAPPPPPAAAP
ncbi:SCO3242 family prenyltransferase [Streptomyces sp. GESEQ-4]|uniref:SCO3242 family prenyltransferase n=1 Tax=Streptomyces sp. GESEQ-4 TaxID=2812655 RepID=UPI0027DCDE96|nr:UbiA family prenyltransferase [Streptomyces sp. GESEQ-4]